MPEPSQPPQSAKRDLGPVTPSALAVQPSSGLTRRQRLRSLGGWLLIASLLILLDQATKAWVLDSLTYAQRIPVLPVFDLTLLYNTGAAFSFLADGDGTQRWLFTGIAGVVSLVILRWLYTQAGQRLLGASLACILGGALGNALDRLLHGHVVDFLLFYWRDWYFPAFNVADIAITCGAVLLILDEILRSRRTRHP
ncbi:signal peptidase II [Castellaniella sp.]|uniref:signal peptidase II n=1 Tax=Castellaniella sp. TaxID=1955812 RepID=UPI002AFE77FA|nr:signal peptidase II [Castellaniella sp.]